ncbi:MAG: 4Fe-4S binding protein [Holosporaceae bacterium]|jgi:Fe-S-cluster-containing hydrogenase component 2|nr:4Fe-4S binding protein [Holosporaceae bacterium]
MEVVTEKCKKCLECVRVCPVLAVSEKDGKTTIDKSLCLECGCCASVCPNGAIKY